MASSKQFRAKKGVNLSLNSVEGKNIALSMWVWVCEGIGNSRKGFGNKSLHSRVAKGTGTGQPNFLQKF